MIQSDLQRGGGYIYQWECAILLALNYFFKPACYNAALFDLVRKFLGEITEIRLEGGVRLPHVGPEGEDEDSDTEMKEVDADLEDIALISGHRRILIQVKTKQVAWGHWTPSDPLLLKAIGHFYASPFLTEQADDTRFVFLTNQPFNRDLVRVQTAIREGTLDDCPEADTLLDYLGRDMDTLPDPDRFRQMLICTALVKYLDLEAVKANIQTKLQAYGHRDWQAAYDRLLQHFAYQSTRLGGGMITRESIGELLGPSVLTRREARSAPFIVPFIPSLDFVGRQEDLERLHEALNDETPVGIRPVGLIGMGGIGKTQLAIEYTHLYRDHYPGGVLWINAAKRVALGFAALGRSLRPATAEWSEEEQICATADYLRQHSDTLLVVDTLADPTTLNQPIASGVIPAALRCRMLFTTRRRDLGKFTPIEVMVLPEAQALQLLLRHRDRQPVLDPGHLEHEMARSICRLLGWLPLALEIAGAFLGEWPDVLLADFRARLLREGCLATLDEEVVELSPSNLSLIHDAALVATLSSQWDTLRDRDARLLLRVAGQLPEAVQIPVARLGLLSGIPEDEYVGCPSRLARSLKHLERASLVEEFQEAQIRLHPLVREFAARQTPETETRSFRRRCADRLNVAYEDLATLAHHWTCRGIDALQEDLLTALNLLPSELQAPIEDLLRLLQREAHNLWIWAPGRRPAFFAQQIHHRAASLKFVRLATGAAAYLTTHAIPFLQLQWRASSESLTLARTLTGHEDRVLAAALTPDGRRAVSASDDRTLKVWDLATGETVATLRGHEGGVPAVALTPDGRRAVSASDDGTLKVWDLASGGAVATLHGHESLVLAVALTSDGRRAVSASDDGTLKIWNLAAEEALVSGEAMATLRGHEGGVLAVALTPDGQRAVSASDDRTLKVWNLASGEAVATLYGHGDWVRAVALTSDGRRAVSTSDDGTLKVWNLARGEAVATLYGHEGGVHAVALTPDGLRAVSASDDRTLKVWDLAAGEVEATLYGHQGRVLAVALTPDGRRAVSASDDSTLKVWDLATGEAVAGGEAAATLRGHQSEVLAVALTLAGRRAVSASDDGTLKVWDLATGEVEGTLYTHEGGVLAVALTPDGRRVVSASLDGTLKTWDLASGETPATLCGHEGGVLAVALTPDGRRVVSASLDGTLKVWDLATGEAEATLYGHEGGVLAVALTPDGQRVVSASDDRALKVWDMTTGEAVATMRGHEGRVLAVVLTPDGRRAVSASDDGTLKVWDLETGEAEATLYGHKDGVLAVALTPDGRRAVSASDDGTLKVWDLETGEAEATLCGHQDGVLAVALSPDGQRAVSASDDRTLKVWDLTSGEELAAVALDGALRAVSMASDGVSIVTGDRAGNVYCLKYVEPSAK